MDNITFAYITDSDVVLFGTVLFFVVFALLLVFAFGVWLSLRNVHVLSPYSQLPLRRARELSYDSKLRVLRYLFELRQFDNRIFEFKKAALCRETGRIFQDAITWYDTIKLDWTFLQKRYPGRYVSWGSLTPEQQEIVKSRHDTLAGFQVEYSSPNPKPKAIELKYALAKPGPLYVDIDTYVLLGWKIVPETDLEVLIVQKPVTVITPSVT